MAAAVLPLALAACSADQLCSTISPNHYDNCMEAQRQLRRPLHDNCPGQFPCGGQTMPVYEPPPPPYFPQVPVSIPEAAHIRVDPTGQFDGSAPGSNCPFIPLPGTNYCVVPMP